MRIGFVLGAAIALAGVSAGCAAPAHHSRTGAANDPHISPGATVKRARSSTLLSTGAGLAAIDRVLAYTSYIRVGSRRRKDVALTFDDGPSPYTQRILTVLEHEHVPATFFEIGRQAKAFAGLTRRETHDGFAVGDHTQNHPAPAALSARAQQTEIVQGARSIQSAGAQAPRLFRPPYGSFNADTLATLHARRMLMVLWSADTKDYSQPGVKRIVYVALSGARAGAIILMHDGGGPREQTVAALPRIIRGLKRRGYHLVTVTQLVADDPPSRSQGPPVGLSGAG